MRELYQTLKNWFGETFGTPRDPTAIIKKLGEEVFELEIAVDNYEKWQTYDNRRKVQEEMADTVLVIINLATNYGMCYNDFLDNLYIKHSKNKKRAWEKQEDGTYKHTSTDE
jgi:NTP pyrophosphatase (non-canonical NTP hydrolase)